MKSTTTVTEPTKRIDPVSRPPLGAFSEDPWAGKDPNRHYVEVSSKADWHGVDHYMAMGYEIETMRPGGPRLKSGRARGEGNECARLGNVLMSCPLEEHQARVAEGQVNIDAIARKMANPAKNEGAVSRGGTRVSYDEMTPEQ